MSYTLGNLTYFVASELGVVTEGTATGGSTTTIIDTNDRTEADDYWNGGTAWILRDAGGASAAPEGEYSIISDFTATTDTVTVRTAFTVTPAVGDRYALGKKRYPLNTLIQCVNKAIVDLGTIPVTDITTVTTASEQTEYTLPGAASRDLREVWIQVVDDDANDNRWSKLHNWSIQRTTTGTGDLLVFPLQPNEPYKLKLVYMGEHLPLYVYSDKLNETIPRERIIYRAVFHALNWFKQKTSSNEQPLAENIARYESLATRAMLEHPINIPFRTPRVTMARGEITLESEPGKAYL